MPTTLPSSDAARGALRSKEYSLPPRMRRSLAEMATSSCVEVWSVAHKRGALRDKRRHPRWQWTTSSGSTGASRDSENHPRDGVSGPFRHLSVWRLWKFVGRARDPCRSTVRVSIGTRVIYYFCNVYKRAPVMGVPLVTGPKHCCVDCGVLCLWT